MYGIDRWNSNNRKDIKFEKTVEGFEFSEVKDIFCSVLNKHNIKYERLENEPDWKEKIEFNDSQLRLEIEQGFPSDKRTKITIIGSGDIHLFSGVIEDLTNTFNHYHKRYTVFEKIGDIVQTTIVTGIFIVLIWKPFISRL